MADESIVIRVGADLKGLQEGLERVGEMVETKLDRGLNSASQSLMGVGMGITAGVTLPLVGAGFASLKLAGQFEQTETAFTNMLGGAKEAKSFLGDLSKFAASTPFELTGLQQSSKKLLAFGFESKSIIPMMTNIGDAIAGIGGGSMELDRVTLALGQIKAKGKASAEELNQLAELGIPVREYLAKALGVDVPTAMKKVEQGAVDAGTTIDAVLQGMKGQFGGMMGDQSKSMLGMWSNVVDLATQSAVKVGQAILPMAKSVLTAFLPVLTGIGKMAEGFNKLPQPVQIAIGAIVGLVALVGPITTLAGAGLKMWETWNKISWVMKSILVPAKLINDATKVGTTVTGINTGVTGLNAAAKGALALAEGTAAGASINLTRVQVISTGVVGVNTVAINDNTKSLLYNAMAQRVASGTGGKMPLAIGMQGSLPAIGNVSRGLTGVTAGAGRLAAAGRVLNVVFTGVRTVLMGVAAAVSTAALVIGAAVTAVAMIAGTFIYAHVESKKLQETLQKFKAPTAEFTAINAKVEEQKRLCKELGLEWHEVRHAAKNAGMAVMDYLQQIARSKDPNLGGTANMAEDELKASRKSTSDDHAKETIKYEEDKRTAEYRLHTLRRQLKDLEGKANAEADRIRLRQQIAAEEENLQYLEERWIELGKRTASILAATTKEQIEAATKAYDQAILRIEGRHTRRGIDQGLGQEDANKRATKADEEAQKVEERKKESDEYSVDAAARSVRLRQDEVKATLEIARIRDQIKLATEQDEKFQLQGMITRIQLEREMARAKYSISEQYQRQMVGVSDLERRRIQANLDASLDAIDTIYEDRIARSEMATDREIENIRKLQKANEEAIGLASARADADFNAKWRKEQAAFSQTAANLKTLGSMVGGPYAQQIDAYLEGQQASLDFAKEEESIRRQLAENIAKARREKKGEDFITMLQVNADDQMADLQAKFRDKELTIQTRLATANLEAWKNDMMSAAKSIWLDNDEFTKAMEYALGQGGVVAKDAIAALQGGAAVAGQPFAPPMSGAFQAGSDVETAIGGPLAMPGMPNSEGMGDLFSLDTLPSMTTVGKTSEVAQERQLGTLVVKVENGSLRVEMEDTANAVIDFRIEQEGKRDRAGMYGG